MMISPKQMITAVALTTFFVSATASLAQSTYSLDDGTAELATGANAGEAWGFFNRFQVSSGNSSIASIEIEWASFSPGNQLITAAVWSDPNQNGTPEDSSLIGSSIATLSNAGSGFQSFDLQTPVDVGIDGSYFFVGFYYQNTLGNELYVGMDDSGSNQSFAVTNGPPFDPDALAIYAQTSNLMIRATVVPEPASLCLLGMSGVLFTLRRRR